MANVIFYTELDKIIGCTRSNLINGEPFCDACGGNQGLCSFNGKCKQEIEQKIRNEKELKATFVKLYLEKVFRI